MLTESTPSLDKLSMAALHNFTRIPQVTDPSDAVSVWFLYKNQWIRSDGWWVECGLTLSEFRLAR